MPALCVSMHKNSSETFAVDVEFHNMTESLSVFLNCAVFKIIFAVGLYAIKS